MAADPASLTGVLIEVPVAAADWLVVAPVAIALTVGALLMMFRHEMRLHAGLAALGLAAMAASDAALLWRVLDSGPVAMTMGRWLPPFGISFTADVLGASFALVATLVALACLAYSVRDIGVTGRRYGFYPFLMLMMGGVSGAFLTGDVFNLYVWFEVFLISSFGLLILGSEKAQIDGATKYAILNLLATAFFLIATAYLYGSLGTLNMADIARKVESQRSTIPLVTISALYFLAFGMKAAAFPLNFWLPASYHTPRIVTAALFGGLLTKVGIYALLRTLVMLFPVERAALAGLIGWVAIATMILGVMGALAQTDVRRMFGFIVISGVGVMLAGLALGDAAGLAGTVLYAVHSMLAMSALYLLGGLMRERGGSYALDRLSGLYRADPLLAALALVLFLAASGLPPGSGLWPKVMLTKASLDAGQWELAGAILFSGLLTTLALGRVFALAFWRDRDAGETNKTKGSRIKAQGYMPVLVLTAMVIVIGLYPEPFIQISVRAAAGLLDPSAYLNAVFPEAGR